MNTKHIPRVVISNGFKNFHLSSAAAEANKRGALITLFCGLYPKRWIQSVLVRCGLNHWKKAGKLLGRRVDVDERRIRTFLFPEFLNEIALLGLRFLFTKKAASKLNAVSMRKFANSTAGVLRRSGHGFEIYHYRSGFGLASLAEARRKGAVLLCDQSIAHPLVLDRLIRESGTYAMLDDRAGIDPLWQLVLADIESADHIVVNSSFVKRTCEFTGIQSDMISVVYWGIDDTFLRSIPKRRGRKSNKEDLRFLFAGSFGNRKGANFLLEAISLLPRSGWRLHLAGTIEPGMESAVREVEMAFPVTHLGNLTREQLAYAMSDADVFVFPSLAEGSARVIFEAMACGCYIITTPNAGSIVEDGVHGRIVPPGDAVALGHSLMATIDDNSVPIVGAANAVLISENYTQKIYGEKLAALYASLARVIERR